MNAWVDVTEWTPEPFISVLVSVKIWHKIDLTLFEHRTFTGYIDDEEEWTINMDELHETLDKTVIGWAVLPNAYEGK